MNNHLSGSRSLLVVMALVSVSFIALTLFLFTKQNVFRASLPNEFPSATSSTPAVQSTASSTNVSVVQEKRSLPDGVTQEVRNEVLVKEWKHSNGTVVTLYEKDYFYSDFSSEPAKQISLRVMRPGQPNVQLLDNVPVQGTIWNQSVTDVEYSPRGTYLAVSVAKYESSRNYIFDLSTGAILNDNDANQNDWNDWPYWSVDEQKVLILRSGSAMTGTPARVAYSQTGKMKDLLDIVDIGKLINKDNKDIEKQTFDAALEYIISDGKTASFEIATYDYPGRTAIPVTFDFATGLAVIGK